MSTDLLVAVSAQITMQQRMDAIAQNIANVATAGYRAEGIRFETVLAEQDSEKVAYASSGESYISRKGGPINYTGNDLDVAVDGDGWFGLDTPDGRIYTRDGRFHLTEFGDLQSVNGYAVVDPGGAAIIVDPNAGPLTISEGGMITQNGKEVGTLGLFAIPENAALRRYDNSGVVTDEQVLPVEDLTTSGVRQGYVEGSNVNPVQELARLISVSRAYENATAAVQNADDTTEQAIRTLVG